MKSVINIVITSGGIGKTVQNQKDFLCLGKCGNAHLDFLLHNKVCGFISFPKPVNKEEWRLACKYITFTCVFKDSYLNFFSCGFHRCKQIKM